MTREAAELLFGGGGLNADALTDLDARRREVRRYLSRHFLFSAEDEDKLVSRAADEPLWASGLAGLDAMYDLHGPDGYGIIHLYLLRALGSVV